MSLQNGSDEQRLYSIKASHALSLPEQGTARAPSATGRPLPPQGASTFNIDELQPEESQPELQVMPITMVRTDYKLEHSQQIAVNAQYICYGLKAGQVRVLNKHSASRSLFKGHSAVPLADMAFFSLDSNLLATASRAGDVFVRLIREPGADGPHSAVLMRAKLPPGSDQALPKLAWHPAMPQILAGASGARVCLFMVPSEEEAGPDDDSGDNAPPETLPGIEFALPGDAVATALAFSPAGDLLAAADSMGRVSVWRLEGNADDSEPPQAPLLVFEPYADAERDIAPGSITFLDQRALLTGDAANRTLKLWLLPEELDEGAPALLQTVSFASARGAEDFFNHLVLQPSLGLVVLANSARQQVYVLHYSGAGSEDNVAALDYLASFLVKQSILSVTTMVEAAEAFENGSSGIISTESLLLYCVQTDAIQQYTVNAALCKPSSDMSATVPASAVPQQAPAATAAAVEPEVQQPAAKQQQLEVSAPLPAPVVDLQAPAGPAATEEEAAEAAAATAAAADAAAELPEIPGPPEAPELPVVQPHGLQELLLAAHPPAPTMAAAEDGDAAGLRPVSTGQPAAAVADGAEVQPPQTLPSPMRLLRPNELREAALRPLPAGHGSLESAGSTASSEVSERGRASVLPRAAEPSRPGVVAAIAAAATAVKEAFTLESPAPAAAAAKVQAHALDLEEGEIAAAEPAPEAAAAPEALAAAPEALAAAPEAAAPEAAATAGPCVQRSEPAAAVAAGGSSEELAGIRRELEQLVAMQQKLAAQMATSHKDMLSGVKGALRTTENTLGQKVEAALKASAKRSDEERKKAAAAERKELEKTLGQQVVQASAGVVRDLSKALQDSSERQSRAVVSATTAALTPLLTTALRSALAEAGAPNGALSGAVERALGAQLQGALAGPVGDALRETFSATVLPAFERATQVMFGQIEAAFTAWLQDQARTSSSANAEVASSLAATASDLTGLVSNMRTEVLESQRALSRMASGTSMGGASERSVQSAQVPQDPKKAILSLLAAHDYEAAFGRALGLADIPTLMWLCRKVDSAAVTGDPSPLSQVVLLSLLQQLAADLSTDAELKLDWLTNVAPCVQPGDPQVAPHLRNVLGGVMANLKALMGRLSSSDPVAKKGKVAAHLVNSLLHQ